MARILYGIHGTGHGHAMRGLTIARKLHEHEFLFIANDDALRIFGQEFEVCPIPNLGTVFKDYKVDISGTVAKAIPILAKRQKITQDVINIIEDFKPDVCMTDLEYFVPRAARQVGLPCLTLDHQHVLTCCEHDLPANMLFDYFLQGLTPRYLFSPTEQNLIVSFYAPPVKAKYNARIVPPILRDIVTEQNASNGEHVLVYQSNATHKGLVDFLKLATKRTCYVFGYDQIQGSDGNVIFMPKSEQTFLDLLSSCAYVILGGGHTLMTEALFFGKPILTLPIMAMVEQRLNAHYIERLGYGMQAQMLKLSPSILQNFEQNIPIFKENIFKGNFCGNSLVFELVNRYVNTKTLSM